jgi:hypothetical protein
MNAYLKQELERKIQQWMDDNSGKEEWPAAKMGEKTAGLMAAAAVSVFDAVVEAQEHAAREDALAKARARQTPKAAGRQR